MPLDVERAEDGHLDQGGGDLGETRQGQVAANGLLVQHLGLEICLTRFEHFRELPNNC